MVELSRLSTAMKELSTVLTFRIIGLYSYSSRLTRGALAIVTNAGRDAVDAHGVRCAGDPIGRGAERPFGFKVRPFFIRPGCRQPRARPAQGVSSRRGG